MKSVTLFAVSILLFFSSFSIYAAPVNINKADAQSISDNLKGIGLKKAQAIIDYRSKHGSFKTAEDLSLVKGIGLKTVEKNKQDIQL